MTKSAPSSPSRAETILAYMGAAVIGLSILSIIIALIGSLLGLNSNLALFAQIPLLGLPLGFLMILVLLFLSIRRRGRENKS